MSLPKAIRANLHAQLEPGYIIQRREAVKYQLLVRVRVPFMSQIKKKRESCRRSRPRGLDQPSRANPGKASCPEHTRILFFLPPVPRAAVCVNPATFRSTQKLPAFSYKNRKPWFQLWSGFSILCPTTVGTSRVAVSPQPRHNSSIVPRVPPGPKPHPLSLQFVCARFVHCRLAMTRLHT